MMPEEKAEPKSDGQVAMPAGQVGKPVYRIAVPDGMHANVLYGKACDLALHLYPHAWRDVRDYDGIIVENDGNVRKIVSRIREADRCAQPIPILLAVEFGSSAIAANELVRKYGIDDWFCDENLEYLFDITWRFKHRKSGRSAKRNAKVTRAEREAIALAADLDKSYAGLPDDEMDAVAGTA